MKVGTGLSTSPDTGAAVKAAAAEALVGAGADRADAALCWVTAHHAHAVEELGEFVGEILDVPYLAGCVAAGVTVGEREVTEGPAVAIVALTDPDPDRFRSVRGRNLDQRPEDVARALVERTGGDDMVFAMLSTSSLQPRPFLWSLFSAGPRATVVGGGAVNVKGPDYVFTEAGPDSNGAVGLVIRGCGPMVGVSHSYLPITPPMLVTASRGRVLLELDHRPALDVLVELIKTRGFSEEDLGKSIMVCMVPRGTRLSLARGEYVVRPLLGAENRLRALFLGEEIEDGAWLSFVFRDRERARMDLNAVLMEAQGALAGRPPPSFAFSANCSSRGERFQGVADLDATITSAYLRQVPLAGFFSGFELAPFLRGSGIHLFSNVLAMGW